MQKDKDQDYQVRQAIIPLSRRNCGTDSLCLVNYNFTDSITREHHQEVYERLFDARENWYSLGGALGLDIETRNTIDIKHRGDVQRCLEEMIAKQLQSGSSLTWKDLCTSLRKSTVNRNDVATEIEHQIGEFK